MFDNRLVDWVTGKLAEHGDTNVLGRTNEGCLTLETKESGRFHVAVLGEKRLVSADHISPLLELAEAPSFVLNVPSGAIWDGPAIDLVHGMPASFGGLGDLGRAARCKDPSSYRFRNYDFVETGIRQHSAVEGVTRIYDRVFLAHRRNGDLTVAIVEAYEMGAEDIRRARDKYGPFDIAVKDSSYGGISRAAHEAAASMGAEACMWGDLLKRLRH